MTGPELQLQTETDWRSAWQEFPYWLIAIIGFRPRRNTYIHKPEYRQAFDFIVPGIAPTARITFLALHCNGHRLMVGLRQNPGNTIIRNNSHYVHRVYSGGVPTLVFDPDSVISTVVPAASNLFGFENSSVPPEARGIISLAII